MRAVSRMTIGMSLRSGITLGDQYAHLPNGYFVTDGLKRMMTVYCIQPLYSARSSYQSMRISIESNILVAGQEPQRYGFKTLRSSVRT